MSFGYYIEDFFSIWNNFIETGIKCLVLQRYGNSDKIDGNSDKIDGNSDKIDFY